MVFICRINNIQTYMNGPEIILKLLLLVDTQEEIELIKRELDLLPIPYEYHTVQDAEDFLQKFQVFKPDLIIAEYAFSRLNCLMAFELTQKYLPRVPFIFLVNPLDRELAQETILSEAAGFVTKNQMNQLNKIIDKTLFEYRDDNKIWPTRLVIAKSRKLSEKVSQDLSHLVDLRIAIEETLVGKNRRLSA